MLFLGFCFTVLSFGAIPSKHFFDLTTVLCDVNTKEKLTVIRKYSPGDCASLRRQTAVL